MIRARFYTDSEDYRPVKWPIKYPYWCSGETHRASILIAYADSVEEIYELWPEAYQIEWEEVDEIVFTSRFPRPRWYKEDRS
jgi:hypothetical protein